MGDQCVFKRHLRLLGDFKHLVITFRLGERGAELVGVVDVSLVEKFRDLDDLLESRQ
jgi:hypothetical protein